MREIKFRAWDTEEKRMVIVDVIMFLANGKFKVLVGEEQIEGPNLDTIWEPILMQFTGLLDKNGKDIYESDIIMIAHPHKTRYFDGPVEWLDYGWGCKDFHFSHFDSPVDIFSEGTEYIKVIGNIYQTPDLL